MLNTEPYGVFIRISQNLSGLADAQPDLNIGDIVLVRINNIIKNKMKVKLSISSKVTDKNLIEEIKNLHNYKIEYKIKSGHIDKWVYSVPEADKVIESVFK